MCHCMSSYGLLRKGGAAGGGILNLPRGGTFASEGPAPTALVFLTRLLFYKSTTNELFKNVKICTLKIYPFCISR